MQLVLEKSGRPGAFIGGVAVIAWGVARFTADIDCTIEASVADAGRVLRVFERGGFEARVADAEGFAAESMVLLLRHVATGVSIDASLAQMMFETDALARSVKRRFGSTELWVPVVSDLLIYKLIAGRPKDLQDASELLALGYQPEVSRIETTLREFDSLLETNRFEQWQRLMQENQ